MSEVHAISTDPAPTDRDIMLWDSIEEEWRVSHWHAANNDDQGWCPMGKRDLLTTIDDVITIGLGDVYAIPIMTAPTHWAEMLEKIVALAA